MTTFNKGNMVRGGGAWQLNNDIANESSCLSIETPIKTLDTRVP